MHKVFYIFYDLITLRWNIKKELFSNKSLKLHLQLDQTATVEVENCISESLEGLLKKHQIVGVNWIYNSFVKVIKMITYFIICIKSYEFIVHHINKWNVFLSCRDSMEFSLTNRG